MPCFVITSSAQRDKAIDAVMCDPGALGYPDRKSNDLRKNFIDRQRAASPLDHQQRGRKRQHDWSIDTEKFKVTLFLTDGTSLPPLDLMPLFKKYDELTR